MIETDHSTLLDGRVRLNQPVKGYRAGMDAVLLAASLEAKAGTHVVELGCGVGGALLCAARRLEGVHFTAWEREAWAAEIARSNVNENALGDRVEIVSGDISEIAPRPMADQVFCNPPFFDDPSSLRTPAPEKQHAWLTGDTPLPVWTKAAARLIKGQGYLTFIHRADALPDILSATEREFGSVVIKPVQPRAGREAKRVIVRVRKGGRAPARILAPLVLHAGEERAYAPEVQAIYAGGALVLE